MNDWTFCQKALVTLAGLQLLWALAGFIAEPSFQIGADAAIHSSQDRRQLSSAA